MIYEDEPATTRLPAVLGIASVVLLAAALRWAHHWGALADLIVASWAAATIGALVVSLRSTDGAGRRAAVRAGPGRRLGRGIGGCRHRRRRGCGSGRRLRGRLRGIRRGDPEPWDG
jgi:hypothetical protein